MNENHDQRWRVKPEGSTWGDFGTADVLGRLNLLDATKIREGIAEVIHGEAFSIGLPLNLPGGNLLNPNRLPPVARPNFREGKPNVNFQMGLLHEGATDVLNDDLIILHTQYSTQWDAFGHVGSMFDVDGEGAPQPVFYNGYKADRDVIGTDDPSESGIPEKPLEEFISSVDLGPVGIGSLAAHPIQGRAVLIDLKYHFGADHRSVSFDDISKVISQDRLEVKSGDILLIHTGYAAELIAMNGAPDCDYLRNYGCSIDGTDTRTLQWITDKNIVAIAADNYAVETYPAKITDSQRSILPLHEHCLFKLGALLGELWFLTDLANRMRELDRFYCLLSAPPLNIPGASGSPLNPIATI